MNKMIYMRKYCCLSCNKLAKEKDKPKLVDKDDRCPKWAAENKCVLSPSPRPADAKECYSWKCSVEGQTCPAGAGGAGKKNYCCKGKEF